MLERSNKFKFSKKSYKAFKNNGKDGVDGFIEANTTPTLKEITGVRWGYTSRKLQEGKAVAWKNKLMLPIKINTEGLKTQKITSTVDIVNKNNYN